MSKGPFLKFDAQLTGTPRITGTWAVRSVKADELLGWVKWYAPWRRYTFCTSNRDCFFDYACLTEIANFISEQMEARK